MVVGSVVEGPIKTSARDDRAGRMVVGSVVEGPTMIAPERDQRSSSDTSETWGTGVAEGGDAGMG